LKRSLDDYQKELFQLMRHDFCEEREEEILREEIPKFRDQMSLYIRIYREKQRELKKIINRRYYLKKRIGYVKSRIRYLEEKEMKELEKSLY